MPYISTFDRNQMMFCSWDSFIDPESIARLIDAFVDSLSEHPFGTIKRAMGATCFLLKGLRKVTGEFALFCLGYNIERAKNLLGIKKMMELMERA